MLLGLNIGLGDGIALGAVVCFAGYTVLLKRAKFDLPTLPLLVILLAAGSLAALPFSLWEIAHGEHEHLARTGYLALAYAGVIGGAFMYFLYNWSVGVLGAARAGTLVYSQMLFATFFAWLILGERIEWYHWLGGSLVDRRGAAGDAAAARGGRARVGAAATPSLSPSGPFMSR